jgi:very-short-patch-repair endonuclease
LTTVYRTLIDLGAVTGEEHVEIALDCALRRRMINLERLQRRLDVLGRGCRGAGVLRTIMRKRGNVPGTGSALETRVARLLRTGRLPVPVRQFVISAAGRFVARVDFAYPALLIAIEVDSRRHHLDPRDWERDLARRNTLSAMGWLVLHFTSERISRDPGGVLREVRAALEGVRLTLL